MVKPKQDRRYKQSNIGDIKDYEEQIGNLEMEITEEKLNKGGINGSTTIYSKTLEINSPRSEKCQAEKLIDDSSKRKFSSP